MWRWRTQYPPSSPVELSASLKTDHFCGMNDLRWKFSTAPTMNWTDCELGSTMAGVGFRSRSSRGCSYAACRRFLADRAIWLDAVRMHFSGSCGGRGKLAQESASDFQSS
jgi:hypothetical protein